MGSKPIDIYFPKLSELSISEPFVRPSRSSAVQPDLADQEKILSQSLDLSTTCPVFSETGKCREGLKCRFLGAHSKLANGDASQPKEIQVEEDPEKCENVKESFTELNPLRPGLLKSLRTRQVSRSQITSGCFLLTIVDSIPCHDRRSTLMRSGPMGDVRKRKIMKSLRTASRVQSLL
jgi:tRNA-dihydrouridine synthase 3